MYNVSVSYKTTKRMRLEWFGHMKRRDTKEKTPDYRRSCSRGRARLRWTHTVRRDTKAWRMRDDWANIRDIWKGSA